MPTSPPTPPSAGGTADATHRLSRGEFIIAKYACGCPVKVRDADAAERMAQINCKQHS